MMSFGTHASGLSAEQVAVLRNQALSAAQKAYAPYSSFRVGAAILLEDGQIFAGCNVENSSYRLTSCAEQVAIGKAISEVGPAIRLRAVVVVNLNNASCSPCGACRQTLLEFGTPETWVFFPDNGVEQSISLQDLVPFGFRLQHE